MIDRREREIDATGAEMAVEIVVCVARTDEPRNDGRVGVEDESSECRDAHPDGTRTVFFELNGQPREVKVVDHSLEVTDKGRPKAVPGDPKQIAAPMPGMVVTVAVQEGSAVTKGQKLLTMEAMKMETTLYAEQDGKVSQVLVQPGTQVDTGDLVILME